MKSLKLSYLNKCKALLIPETLISLKTLQNDDEDEKKGERKNIVIFPLN